MTSSATTNGASPSAICSSADDFLRHSYDYIIAGGGTAGLVLAARLTENPNMHVGVLEAGKNRLDDPMVNIPALFTQMLSNPEYDWLYTTVPQEGNMGRIHAMPRGKMLGGSSGTNYMLYTRGSNADWDDWAKFGDPSWSAEELRKYFRKHETLDPIDRGVTDRSFVTWDAEYHGTDGPIHTSFNNCHMPFDYDFLRACDQVAGRHAPPKDPWSGDHLGFYSTLGTVDSKKGTRSYAASGYLAPNLTRPNLKVLTEATVCQIRLEGDSATGIQFLHGDKDYFVSAKEEVIVSCGVIGSPQVLELSGIGDPEVLRKSGVECKIALPGVGANLQDHSLGALSWKLAPGVESLDVLQDQNLLAQAQKTYAETQKGVLSAVTASMGFLSYSTLVSPSELENTVNMIRSTPQQTEFEKQQREQVIAHLSDPRSSNIQFVMVPVSTCLTEEAVADQRKLVQQISPGDLHGAMVSCNLAYPISRGTVHITSSDPAKQPAIDPGLMRHAADVEVAVAGLRFMDKVGKSKMLKDKIAERVSPSPDLDLDDTEAARKYVQGLTASEYHPVGTCAMSQVVDSKLKVKGVGKLRVVDASIFPNHVSGNIMSSVYAVAEKAADMIKAETGS